MNREWLIVVGFGVVLVAVFVFALVFGNTFASPDGLLRFVMRSTGI